MNGIYDGLERIVCRYNIKVSMYVLVYILYFALQDKSNNV